MQVRATKGKAVTHPLHVSRALCQALAEGVLVQTDVKFGGEELSLIFTVKGQQYIATLDWRALIAEAELDTPKSATPAVKNFGVSSFTPPKR